MTFKPFLPLALASFVVLAGSPSYADNHVKVGSLRCEVSGGVGLIITSDKGLECSFTSVHGWKEHYHGDIRKFGLDIGATKSGVLVWEVFAPTDGPRRHALAGSYVGADASASVGVGGGANALVGGFDRSFTLQPFSVEGQQGVALAAGVEDMHLK